MLGFMKNIFSGLLASVVNTSDHTKCVSLSNWKCEIKPTVVIYHSNEYNPELCYYSFAVNLDRCVRSCNSLNDLSNEVCIPNKTEDLNLRVFTWLHEQINQKHKQSIYHGIVNVNLTVEHVIQINSGIMINVGARVKIQSKHCVFKNNLFNAAFSCENCKILASILTFQWRRVMKL